MPRIRSTLVIATVAAVLLPVAAIPTANSTDSKGASTSRQVEQLRQIEQQRLQAAVEGGLRT